MPAIQFEITGASKGDESGLLELAGHLDSVNLPNDPAAVHSIVDHAHRSFSGNIGDPRLRQYVFVLKDLEQKRVVGSSLIVGQLGRRDAPYIYLRVRKEERYSQTLDKHFVHDVLSIGYSYDGPTEIGGLIMHPGYRRVGQKLGMQISYVRFLFIAMHRADFQNHILAELLPPLGDDGTSHLWEAVGRRFTGMSYKEADRLSRRNKEFIWGLFPDGDIYASLLTEEARSVIGKVGPQTKGVEKMLRRVGFRYVDRVDPFDGGPHFAAPTEEISLIRDSKARELVIGDPGGDAKALMAREYERSPWFRALAAPAKVEQERVTVSSEVAEQLELEAGSALWCLPLV